MIATKGLRIFALLLLCVQHFACPAHAQDWFLVRTEEVLPVRYADREQCAHILGTLVPDASITIVEEGLMVKGTADEMDLVKRVFADLTLANIILDVRLCLWNGVSTPELWTERQPRGLMFGSVNTGAELNSNGSSTILAGESLPLRLGESGKLVLVSTELDAKVKLRYQPRLKAPGEIDSQVQVSIPGHRHVFRLRGTFEDGETVFVKGLFPRRRRARQDAEVVLVLTQHLLH